MESIGNSWMWIAFFVLVIGLLLVDLLVLKGGKNHKVSLKEAAIWSVIWISVAMLFNLGIWYYLDLNLGREIANQKSLEFLTGYVIEKALAVDNVFVWLMIFGYFAIPAELQRRVLLYGVLGAIILRTGMIFAGSWLITQFHWILYLFGAFLVLTGIKMLKSSDDEGNFDKNPLLVWVKKNFSVTHELDGENFFTVRNGVRFATPMFLALILVEISDVIFAVDSIPAIFAVTTDPFIVLTSNIFAIMGLRAMYFLLADFADRFALLKYGLAIILVFIGTKMLIIEWIKLPVLLSLGIVAAILAISVIASLVYSAREGKAKE
ncbi:MAG: TerC family protein [Plesiomonas sp.]|uniref:TerC family protein n=1 Tax=Plesiomonas sp. TaxID=2486279 RepID=UPI003EE53D32